MPTEFYDKTLSLQDIRVRIQQLKFVIGLWNDQVELYAESESLKIDERGLESSVIAHS